MYTHIVNILSMTTDTLIRAGIDTARIDAIALISHVTKATNAQVVSGAIELTKKQNQELNKCVKLRAKRTPLAYISNSKEFYGYDFYVDNRVLVPRPETEDMVSLALEVKQPSSDLEVLDLGCGSGCIGISYYLRASSKYHARPDMQFADISSAALAVCQKNAKHHGVPGQFIKSDLLSEPSLPQDYSIVFANLPYVPNLKKYSLDSPELEAEPRAALYSGKDGLEHYSRLFMQIAELQISIQNLFVECLEPQVKPLHRLAKKSGLSYLGQRGLILHFSYIPSRF